MEEIRSIDVVVAAILGVAMLRGLFLGLIREAFSIGALAGACVAVRLFARPAAEWLVEVTRGEVGPTAAPWIAGAALVIGAVAVVAFAGRLLQRGVRAAGLGWADRTGGALLGGAEGLLMAGLLLLILSATLGREHAFVVDSHSIAALERLEQLAEERELRPIDVAAPPPPRR